MVGVTTLLRPKLEKIRQSSHSVAALEQGLSLIHMVIRRTVLVAVELHTIIQMSTVNAKAE